MLVRNLEDLVSQVQAHIDHAGISNAEATIHIQIFTLICCIEV